MATPRKTRRPALIALVVVSAAVCLALGWWQLDRFESSSGSGQNLGYAFQWPLFAVFVVYAYRRFVQLEDADDDVVAEPVGEPTELPDGVLPTRPDVESRRHGDDGDDPESLQLDEYNRHLANLYRNNDRS